MARWIKKQRRGLGWTREELAVRAGVSLTSVARWEQGNARPSRLMAEKLQHLLAHPSRTEDGCKAKSLGSS